MKAKKLLSIILVGVSAVSLLAGCSSGTSSQDSSAEETAGSTQEESSEETAQSDDQEEIEEAQNDTQGETEESAQETGASDTSGAGNVLVVYYSATGNTENVANIIAETTGGDLFALEPVEPYTDEDLNYSDENSRVSREHEDESLRDVELASTTVDNWDSYDTVFIGYPIWWGIAAWPVDSFVENNDFTGKTVIPFATSASSGLGESGQLLAEMAGTGDWQEGMRFRSSADEADVQEWVNGLGL
ncbi:MAG TPA: flavodoxin [Candidatus Blautia merdipullorum]|nr:flavodoxin [Candidatus Blautia merdipullorum]